MSAKTLMVNEGILQELESRIAGVRQMGSTLLKMHADGKSGFAAGLVLVREYDESAQVLQEMAGLVFCAMDLCDPEDEELARRDEEDEEEEESEDEEGDEEDDEEQGDDEEEEH